MSWRNSFGSPGLYTGSYDAGDPRMAISPVTAGVCMDAIHPALSIHLDPLEAVLYVCRGHSSWKRLLLVALRVQMRVSGAIYILAENKMQIKEWKGFSRARLYESWSRVWDIPRVVHSPGVGLVGLRLGCVMWDARERVILMAFRNL